VNLRLGTGLLVIALAGCNGAPAETPDPAAIPDGPLEARDVEATGPIVELGANVMEGIGWRYAIFPSELGWCTQLETVTGATVRCGAVEPAGDESFVRYEAGVEVRDGVTAIEGIVGDDVATVWLTLAGGARAPALLMPLEEADLAGQAFLRLVPPDVVVTHLQAVALSGEILETIELPAQTTVP
jgi:hypothetical protein